MTTEDEYIEAPLSDARLKALGEIAYWAGQLEESVFQVVTSAIDWHGPVGQRILAGASFTQLVETGIRVFDADHWSATDAGKSFRVIARRLLDAMRERNDALHALWAAFGDDDGAYRLNRKRAGLLESSISVSDLRDTAQMLAHLDQEVFLIFLTMRADKGEEVS